VVRHPGTCFAHGHPSCRARQRQTGGASVPQQPLAPDLAESM
jgi:hypothetical protein